MKRNTKIILVIVIAACFILAASSLTKKQTDTQKLIIFHAGSLSVPFKQICEEFERQHHDVKILREAAGSRACARKIMDLHKPCDVMASADYTVIDTLLIGEHADWNIRFAANEMVIAYRDDSHLADQIDENNWYNVLLNKEVRFGRSDPNSDPCGYRSLLTIKLAERFYKQPGLFARLSVKNRRYIRPKETDLLALLEVGELDYIFMYKSVAKQHELRMLLLPDEINLKKAELAFLYRTATVRLRGKTKDTFITKAATPIVYGVTIPKNSPNPLLASEFLQFLLTRDKGGVIIERNGQNFLVPSPTPTFDKLPQPLRIFALPVDGEVKS